MADVSAPTPADPSSAGANSLAPPSVGALPPSPAERFLVERRTLALFLVSVVGLFLELLLIRWISTEIRVFAYLQNCVLVVCFLGLGMGCWDSRRRAFALRDVLLPLGVLVAVLTVPVTRTAVGEIGTMVSGFRGFLIWEPVAEGRQLSAPLIGLAMTCVLMLFLWATFVPIGRLLGRLMNEHPNTVWAYSVNVAGSLLGIWLFVLVSALYLPPVAWFGLFALGAAAFAGSGGRSRVVDVALLAGLVVGGFLAGWEPFADETRWTPYQKLSARDQSVPVPRSDSALERWLRGARGGFRETPGQVFIAVNNTGYQATIDLRPETVAADPKKFPAEQRGYSQYDLPAKLHPAPKRGLVVGAGSGNDASGMLRSRLERVVAVEIDPGIIDIGRRRHAEQPYSDPRCVVVNDDARSYFATCGEKFDVISFGLLDSHTTTAMTNARLDHYVYTVESFTRAKALLNPGGVMVLSFEAQKPFIADRMGRALEQVFGHKPVMFRVPYNAYGWGGLVFVIGDAPGAAEAGVAADPKLAALVEEWKAAAPESLSGDTPLATDDWPYIYLERPTIPVLYFVLAGALTLLCAFGLYELKLGGAVKQWGGSSWHFFFLGAGFMLLEVQNVSKAAVVLGNTWAVNAVIISGVMVMILLANLTAARLPKVPLAPVYALLVLSCVGLYFLDLSRFAFLPYATKALVVGLLTSLPMLFSGIVFVRSFAVAERKDAALGANLIGSLVGGLLQSVTFVTGIKALLLIVAVLYLAAVLTRPRTAVAPA
ncbi:MAG: spermidine synthase [Gemmata sp.]